MSGYEECDWARVQSSAIATSTVLWTEPRTLPKGIMTTTIRCGLADARWLCRRSTGTVMRLLGAGSDNRRKAAVKSADREPRLKWLYRKRGHPFPTIPIINNKSEKPQTTLSITAKAQRTSPILTQIPQQYRDNCDVQQSSRPVSFSVLFCFRSPTSTMRPAVTVELCEFCRLCWEDLTWPERM